MDVGLWPETYVGEPHFNCAAFARRVLREQRGLDIALPEKDWRRVDPLQAAAIYAGPDGPLYEVELPADKDLVLMSWSGRTTPSGTHIGLAYWHRGMLWVLHSLSRAGVIFGPARQLPALYGLVIMGYYAPHDPPRGSLASRALG